MKHRGSLWIACTALLCGLPGCSTDTALADRLVQTPPPATNATAQLALDLAEADDAFSAGDRQRLRTVLERLRTSGARALDEDAPDRLAQWSQAVGGDFVPFRGRALGPGYKRGTLSAGASTAIDQVFLAGRSAEISVGTRQSAPFRLRLYNAEGQMKCELDPARARACRFTPLFTQRYRIELRNGGRTQAVYFLAVD